MKLLTLLLVVGLLVLGIGTWFSYGAFETVFADEYERFRTIEVGMTEAEVTSALGAPLKVYFRESAPANYYEEGYAFLERPITHKVFIYIGTEPIAYVYFDDDNRVEEVFVGGS